MSRGDTELDFTTVTETTENRLTLEALSRFYTRYAFAARLCEGKDVLDVACGAGQGLGYLKRKARCVVGGDYTAHLVEQAQTHYRGRVPLVRLDAHVLPFPASSFDVVLLNEAIYYLARPDQFLEECRRVLKPQGSLLVTTVNREWRDFHPSPFSTRYFSAHELLKLLHEQGFEAELYGAFPAVTTSARDRIVSLVKRTAVALGLIPRTMKGKEFLKRLFLGPISRMPAEIDDTTAPYCTPVPIAPVGPVTYKVLFAVAHVR